jgi:hypothetical protein
MFLGFLQLTITKTDQQPSYQIKMANISFNYYIHTYFHWWRFASAKLRMGAKCDILHTYCTTAYFR